MHIFLTQGIAPLQQPCVALLRTGDMLTLCFSHHKTLEYLLMFWTCNSFFKTLVDHEVTVELKNEISIRGTLKSVDQFLNIKLDNAEVVEEGRWPHLISTKDMFIRGSVVRYVHLPAAAVDTALLEDATRREAQATKGKAK
ncbi:Sm-like ribonucleoprotein [Zopfia rhizophila CBS 207.26]|uniref:Sm-like ribonucleoprotein n=1 Tax=Zopfia rhizophila CBS 207.26 TaxID=1314779 RepID=A0A6A6D6J2_9PEZI|nr:Sm-like ribonucleoprotein [Zopfia rhizophila CBS 207.26]